MSIDLLQYPTVLWDSTQVTDCLVDSIGNRDIVYHISPHESGAAYEEDIYDFLASGFWLY